MKTRLMIKILIIIIIILIVTIIISRITNKTETNKNDTFTNEINKNLYNYQELIKCLVDEKNSSNSIFLLNNKFYGAPCIYIKDDTFYTVINELGFVPTTNILEAGLIVPCTYEATEQEVIDL